MSLATPVSTTLAKPWAPGRRGGPLTVRDTCPYFPVAGSRRPVDAVIS